MKVLVSDEQYCYQLGDNFYLSDYGATLMLRYLMTFEKIRFVVRTRKVESVGELGTYRHKVNNLRVEIYPVSFFQGPMQYAKVFFSMKKRLKRVASGCDLAILRAPSTTAFAVWDNVKECIPYAVEVVADCYDLYNNSSNLLHKLLWYKMHHKMIKVCNTAIGISCVTRDYLQRHYTSLLPDAIFSHYSSVEMLPEFRYKARKYPKKQTLDVIHIANQVFLNSLKGHLEMLHVLKNVIDSGCDVNLTFVGGDYFGGIKQISDYAESIGVSDRIYFSGFVNTSKLSELLMASDILILPTRAEGLPRVIIEAMALGLPCITTPVSGNPELIDEDFLVDYSNVEGFAVRIKLLISNKSVYEEQSDTNFKRSREYCKDVLDERRRTFFTQLKRVVQKGIIKEM